MEVRSYLFVPGNRPDRFGKALDSVAHAVLIDLEDAVPPADKPRAREQLEHWLLSKDARPVWVRVNGIGTEWFADDRAIGDLPNVAGIVLPKAEQPQDVARVLYGRGSAIRVMPLIESALGVQHLNAIATAPQVARIAFGHIDFQSDMGILGDGPELDTFRSLLVLASRLARLPAPVDSVCTAIDDLSKLESETQRARAFGFGAKLCIHPKQASLINEGFLPSAEQISWARRVVDAFHGSSGAAVRLDGQMIDKPVLLKAEAILAEAPSGPRATS